MSASSPDDALASIYKMLADEPSMSFSKFIEEKLSELHVSRRQFSEATNVARSSLRRILEGEAQSIGVLTLLKIAQFLQVDARQLLQLYVANASPDDIRELEEAKKYGYISRHFDLETLRNIGFIESTTSWKRIERRVNEFFDLDSVFEYSNYDVAPAFSKTKQAGCDRMVQFWVNIVHAQFKKLEVPHEYDEERLMHVVPKLRAATTHVERGFQHFCKMLWECGVPVLVESYLPRTQVKGATMVVNGRPCVVLTNYQKRYDMLWFTLAHELSHVVNDLGIIRSQGFHISGDDQQELFMDETLEETADLFARRILVSDERMKKAARFIDAHSIIQDYAREWGVHPSIIYGFYLYDHPEDYPKYRQYCISSEAALTNQDFEPWKFKTLEETLPEVQAALSSAKKPSS